MEEINGRVKKNQGRIADLFLIGILLIGIFLQIGAAYQKSFWGDEVDSAIRSKNGFEAIKNDLPTDTKPLFIYLMSLWGRLFGYSELGLRSLAILFATLTLILTYILGKEVYDEKTALIGLAVLSLSPLFLLHAHSARYYSMMTTLALLVVLAMYRYQEGQKPWYLLVYAFAGSSMLYLVFNSVIFLIGCNFWWIIRFVQNRKHIISDLVFWSLAQVLILALYFPGFSRFSVFTENYFQLPELTSWLFDFLKRLGFSAYLFSLGGTLSPLNPLAWIGIEVIIIVSVFAVVAVWRKKLSWISIFFTLWISFFAVLATFFSEWHNQIWQNISHWFLYVLPFLALWLGIGLAQMKFRIMTLMGVLLLIVYATGIYNFFTDQQFIQPVLAAPWRRIFNKIKLESKPNTMVICTGLEISCWYYADLYGYSVSLPWQIGENEEKLPSDVWWIHANVGGIRYERETIDQTLLIDTAELFPGKDIERYVLHDPSIRWLKTRMMGHEDFEYLVEVYHFYSP